MVDRLVALGALWSPALVAAFRATPRHLFLDRVFIFERDDERWHEVITREPDTRELGLLYSDRALITRLSRPAIGPAVAISSSSQPSLMAQMLEDLKLAKGLSVLEVGAGTGYNAGLLAHAVGPGLVTSVDVDREVLSEAWDHLRKLPDRKVTLRHADGREGYAEGAPYDRIMVTAATPDLEPAWLEQLADRGLLLAPLTFAPGLSFVVRGTVTEGVFHGRLTRAAYFMPLRAEGELGSSEEDFSFPAGSLSTVSAPWRGWFDRGRRRGGWLPFVQSLAFFGLLRGLRVHYRALEQGEPCYGVREGEALCWFGPREWGVSGEAGQELGRGLWRAFLDAGGPWPVEYRLKASARAPLPVGPREGYLRQGPRCRQSWELAEPRDRPGWV